MYGIDGGCGWKARDRTLSFDRENGTVRSLGCSIAAWFRWQPGYAVVSFKANCLATTAG